jgi:hypothetical protein
MGHHGQPQEIVLPPAREAKRKILALDERDMRPDQSSSSTVGAAGFLTLVIRPAERAE